MKRKFFNNEDLISIENSLELVIGNPQHHYEDISERNIIIDWIDYNIDKKQAIRIDKYNKQVFAISGNCIRPLDYINLCKLILKLFNSKDFKKIDVGFYGFLSNLKTI